MSISYLIKRHSNRWVWTDHPLQQRYFRKWQGQTRLLPFFHGLIGKPRSPSYFTTVTIAGITAGIHKLATGGRRDNLERRLKDECRSCSRVESFNLLSVLRFCSVKSWQLPVAEDALSIFRTV